MNRRNILELIDRLKTLKYNPRIKADDEARNRDRFNMGRYFNECGTPSCMAGHVMAMHGRTKEDYDYADTAADLLELDKEWALTHLFEPHAAFKRKDGGSDFESIAPARAITALRRLLKAGSGYRRVSVKALWK